MIYEENNRQVQNPPGGFFTFCKINMYNFYFLGECDMSS